MPRTLKALSALLTYPSPELRAAAAEIGAALASDGLVTAPARPGLEVLVDALGAADLTDAQEAYVELFDRGRGLSLYLFEHVHGESRDRGQAMIDLQAMYQAGGLQIGASELPDFLPLFLEYLSTRSLAEARELLGQTAHVLAGLADRLRKRGAPYEAVFRALLALSGEEGRTAGPSAETAADGPGEPAELAALDAAWEETPVTFGPEAAPACNEGLVARLRAARRPAPQPPH